MTGPLRVRVCGPLELYARDFGAELLRLGYTRVSAAFQLRLMAHLSRWLVEESAKIAELTPGVIERFFPLAEPPTDSGLLSFGDRPELNGQRTKNSALDVHKRSVALACSQYLRFHRKRFGTVA